MISDQTDFSRALLDPEHPAPANLVSPDGSPAGARFDVYRNNVTTSLLEAMKTGFPVVEKLIGATNFQTLALMYIRAHPPQSPVLMFYGQGFDRFIANFEPLAKLVYLPDVARLELARRDVYHAQDAAIFDASDLAEIGEAGFMAGRLIAAPATRILTSSYPIYDIWLRNSGVPDHAISKGAQHVLLTRPEYDVQSRPITPDVSTFLTHLSQMTVGATVEATLGDVPDFPLGDVLALILQSGFACSFEMDPK